MSGQTTTASLVVALLAMTSVLRANDLVALSDEFDDAGSLVHWSRINQTEGWGNDDLDVLDINGLRPGQLVMTPYSSSWYEEWRGELTYKTMTGDFVVTTFVEPRNRAGTGRPERDYSLAGIMVRSPRTMTNATEWTANGQNYVFLSMGAGNRTTALYQFEVKTTINSTSVLVVTDTPVTRAAIQVARIGPHIIALRREEGQPWAVHRRYFRPDFPATMQVGLTVYTDWPTCNAVGPENNNLLVLTNGAVLLDSSTLSGAQPDLVATFDYVRYARPMVPPELSGVNLSNPGIVSDAQLLAFLGEHANIPGGAVVEPEFISENLLGVVSQRSYRVQSAMSLDGPWTNRQSLVSTSTFIHISSGFDDTNDVEFLRVVSP